MDLKQLRSLVTLAECDFNVSHTAKSLHLVQSAVSQHLSRLEDELGLHLLVRHGKRITGLTAQGELVIEHARRSLAAAESIRAIGQDQAREISGVLRIGTTHTQARYVLPALLRRYRERFPGVDLQLHQASPQQLAEMLLRDQVDIAICTEGLDRHPGLSSISCYRWNRVLVAPHGHPLLAVRPLSLERLCAEPIVTYVYGFTGSSHFRTTFARQGLSPEVVLSAADSDVIKTYVREGLGVGIIADVAYQAAADSDLGARPLDHLFPWEVTRLAYLRDRFLSQYQLAFVELFQAFSPPR